MPCRHWLVKSEPFKYSFEQLVREGRTVWDGVRNYEARNSMRAMAKGDLLLFYHSNDGLAVVGLARVAREAYADPSDPDEDWCVVDVEPVGPLPEPVSLTTIRETPALASMAILRRSRLSVTPVTPTEFDEILRLGKTDLDSIERAAAAAKAPAKKPPASAKKAAAPAPQAAVPVKNAPAPAKKAPSAAKAPSAKSATKAPSAKKASSATEAPSAKKAPSAVKAPSAKKAASRPAKTSPAPRGGAR
jgi:predicted RNA-binding protein with PUA-like domain